MKIAVHCSKCLFDSDQFPEHHIKVVNDSGRYEFQCDKGHTTITILQMVKFELLFEIGAHAITDDYYREAVSSFASSLERFYEFFIKVICHSKNIEFTTIDDSWNAMSKQSERQLGAYIAIYLIEFGCSAPLISNKMIAFRNEVVHKGKIPTKEQAINYGQAVLDLIRPLLKILKEKYHDSVLLNAFHEKQETIEPNDQKVRSILHTPSIVSIVQHDEEYENRTLEEAISQLRKIYR